MNTTFSLTRLMKPVSYFMGLLLFLLIAFSSSAQDAANFSKWMILGPVPVFEGAGDPEDMETQKKAFDKAFLNPADLATVKKGTSLKVAGKSFKWKEVSVKEDMVDLGEIYGDVDFALAYAWTEVVMPKETKVILGVGSDDAVKVFLNGELVHENWVPRALQLDDDLCPVTFKKGKNLLLLKVQDMTLDWSFSCRILPPERYILELGTSARRGDLDNMELLLENGAKVDDLTNMGLTPLQVAKLSGRDDAVKLLLKYGADSNIKLPSKEELAEIYFSRSIDGEDAGVSVLVSQNGKILYEKGFGYANLEHLAPFTKETKSRIGSVTKQFTAAAILKLQEMGKISVNDPLSKYMPDFPRGEEVTIHHLLTHTSGIKSFTDKPGFMETAQLTTTSEELIESFKNDEFDFDPGTNWHYNNSGYFLLSYLVEKISGQSFNDFLKENFFDPIGMENTGVHEATEILKNEAAGYSFIGGKFQKALNWDMSRAGGAGNLYSTVGDLFKWNEAVFNGKVLKDESLKAAFSPVSTDDGKEASAFGAGYGYGWMISKYRGLNQIAHSGGLNGFITYLTRFPDENITIVVLHNAMPPKTINPAQVAMDLAEMYFWERMDKQESFSTKEGFDFSLLDDYVGRYEYPGGAICEITKEGEEHLFAQLSGQPKMEIFPKSDNEFYWKAVDAQIKFVRNDKGEVTHGIHTQNGAELEVPRMKEEKPIKLDPAIYDAYEGKYELAPNMFITVKREGDQLMAELTNQPKIELFPRSETVFFLTIVVADITFVKDDEGEVVSLVLNQGGRKMPAQKVE